MSKIKTDAKMSVAIKQDAVPLNGINVANIYRIIKFDFWKSFKWNLQM